VSGIVVDTSIWIDYFKGISFPIVDDSLKEGSLSLSPIIVSELLSAKLNPNSKKQLIDFLLDLKFINCDFSHWIRVGELRSFFAKKGITVSTPDAHIAQVCIDQNCYLITGDKIFTQISKVVKLKLI
jgi:predicted nucleic acid-binding protein